MTAVLVAPPASEPVSLEEAKAHLRVDTDAEDALISRLIAAARAHVESLTRRALLTQGWRIVLDEWPKAGAVRLSPAPVISVDAVTLYDADGHPSVVPPEAYVVDLAGAPGRLRLQGAGGPARALNGIEIDMTCGYGPAGADVPAPLRQAVLLLVGFWFEHREAAAVEALTPEVCHGVQALAAPYRGPRL